MVTSLRNVDEFYDSNGVLLQPLGYGVDADWTEIDRKAASSSSEIAFTWDETLYDEIEITYLDVRSASDAVAFQCQISDDSGATHEATNYNRMIRFVNSTSTTGSGVYSTAQTLFLIIGSMGSTGSEFTSGKLRILDPGGTGYKAIIADGVQQSSAGTPVDYGVKGYFDGNTNGINGIRFYMGTGNIASGTFILRGRLKAGAELVVNEDWEVITDEANVAAAATHDYFWTANVYDEIEVTLTGCLTNTDDRDLFVRMSTDGSTFDTGSNYRYSMQNFNHTGSSQGEGDGNAAQTTAKLLFELGTAANEYQDVVLHLLGVSGSQYKRGFFKGGGTIASGTFQKVDGILQYNSTSALQGIQLRLDGTATVAFERVRIRGRRVTPRGGTVGGSGGDYTHLGDFSVATGGDQFIDIDMRESSNPQFTSDFQDTDFLLYISGAIGPSNSNLFFRVLRDNVQQSGSSDYKSGTSNSINGIQITASTPGSGRKVVVSLRLMRYNNAASTAFYGLTADSFSADSGGSRLTGSHGGHANGLAAGTNNGVRIYCSAGDMDDIVVSVYGMKRSQT